MMQPNPMMVLSSALGFSAADLYANRIGILTPHQRDHLLKLRNQSFEAWFIGVLAIIVGGLFVHLQFIIVVFGLATLVTVVLTIYLRYEEDFQSRVEMISGRLRYRTTVLPLGGGSQIIIGTEPFTVSRRVKAAFNNGMFYRVYFTAGTHTVLAAELLT